MIEMNSFDREPKTLKNEIFESFKNIYKSGFWVLGKNVDEFENKWAKKIKTKYCAAVANGLDALLIGMKALNIKEGDEVITTPLTAFASTLSIINVGAKPVFVDVDKSGLLNPNNIEKKITKKTKAILYVHLYGQCKDLSKLKRICARNKIYLIEDCAQSHLAANRFGNSGSFGDFAAWSFYPTKNLGAFGDAGAITSNNLKFIKICKKIRNYGQSSRYNHDFKGVNSRMDEIQAGILIEKLKYLNLWNRKRNLVAKKYNQGIKNSKIKILERVGSKKDSYYLYVVQTKFRSRLIKHLSNNKIRSIIHYPILSYNQKFNYKYRKSGNFKNAETISKTCLSIPCHPYLKNDEVNHVIKVLNEF